MRLLLFISIWVFGFAQGLQAQNMKADGSLNVWEDMAIYVQENMENAIPGEIQSIKTLKADFTRQGQREMTLDELRQLSRKAYWENLFMTENRNRILEAKRLNRKNTSGTRTAGAAVNNPDLVANCNLNIAIIVDQSGSVDSTERANIRAGLLAFVQNQVGSGNTLSLIGMGSLLDNTGVVGPSTVTYSPGNTITHINWINSVLFTGSDNADSWSTGMAAAIGLGADLVIIIADGATGAPADLTAACTAGNTLKGNGANGGNGAHLFVFSETPGEYIGATLTDYLTNAIDPNPVPAPTPPTMAGISTSDFIAVPNNDNFTTLATWLGSIIPGGGASVTTTSISPRTCILGFFCITGNYTVCPSTTATSLVLEFWNGGVLQLSVPAALNGNSWNFCSTLQDMIDLGLDYSTWYDVVPVLTLSDGTMVTGQDFVAGQNNDLFFASQSDPVVTVNSSPTNPDPEMFRFCEGDSIYYHGADPLSSNHSSEIRRRPIGSPIAFGEYQTAGFLGASLDGYNGDLNAQYPGYFDAGFEYELTITTANASLCIAPTPVTVIFEVIDCCKATATLTDVPDCVEDGIPFTISLVFDAPISPDQIENIYSSYPNYTYISHTVRTTPDGFLILDILFVSNSCTCEGEQLVFDVILEGCSEPIWIMTDKLPCCVESCKGTTIVNWNAEDCIIVNGNPARWFCLDVQSGSVINDVLEAANNTTCQVELEALEITQTGLGLYTICGYMVFQDPACTGHAMVSLILDTEDGCCLIEQPFSFPGGCVIASECTSADPDIEIIYGTSVNVSLNIPLGQTVTVFDHITGTTSTETVVIVDCGPFGIDGDGNPTNPNDCNGIILTAPQDLDCRYEEGEEEPSFLYYFEIRWGDCVWIIIGDYCNEFIIYPGQPTGGNGDRSVEAESIAKSASGEIRVFPNPIAAEGMLTFDLSKLKTEVTKIRIADLSGKTMESFLPVAGEKVFQHRLESALQHGMYFVILHLNDGTTSSVRVVVTE